MLYNSWEATTFAVDVVGQMALTEKASRPGVERFVVDDGWFKGRNSDHAGLGEWTPDPAKFPNGLKPLIDKVHGLGMEFGLWVEPEMVNPNSDLYRAHPDWVIDFPDRPRTPARNQLMLNLARTDVRDHLFKVLDELLTRNDIQYIKWDYNRKISEPGWPEVGADQQQTLYVEYVRNLYWIFEQLRKRHPHVEFESCSGGGGRIDLGIMALTDQVWPSDNTDPYERLAMQDNFTHAFTPAVMMAWVTDSPNWANKRSTSLEYRFLSSMAGGLGIGADLNHWDAQDMAVATQMVAAYKQIRATVQQGERYRLIPATTGGRRSATLSVAGDKRQAALFLYQTSGVRSDNPFAVQLQGLDPQRRYRISRIGGGELPAGTPEEASGAYWMQHGVGLEMTGDLQARGYVLQAR
ncbi:MAG: Alpha-galactosidase AgaA [Stenotrophomonas maltophilia]|nr:MAG: Alpha-galactosidase AgaA [Stenotrophomonas maltophilia]